MFIKIGVLKNFAIFTGKHLCWSVFFYWSLRPAIVLKKRLQHKCFPVNIAKFFKTAFFSKNTSSGCFCKNIFENRVFVPVSLSCLLAVQVCFYCNHYLFNNQWFHQLICRTTDVEKLGSEAVARRCSSKKLFWKISQNSQENTCARVSFLIRAWGLQLYSKRDSGTGVFLWILRYF